MSTILTDYAGVKYDMVDSVVAGEALVKGCVRINTTTGVLENTDTQGEKAYGLVDKAYASGEMALVIRQASRVAVVVKTASGLALATPNLTPSAEGSPSVDAGKCEVAASADYVFGQIITAPVADDDEVIAAVDFINQWTV